MALFLLCAHASTRVSLKAPVIDGAVGLPLGRTNFDDEWDRVKDAALPTTGPAAAAIRSRLPQWRAMPKAEQFRAVNTWVNEYLKYVRDNDLWSRQDYWATPREVLVQKQGRGDW